MTLAAMIHTPTFTNTTIWIIVGAMTVLYLSLGFLMEKMIQAFGLSPPDDKIGQIQYTKTAAELAPTCNGKKVLLVGGTRGVGLGTAMALARAGARVTVVGRSEKSGRKAQQQIQQQSNRKVSYLQGDLGTAASTHDLVIRLAKRGEKYDYLVVTAAIFFNPNDPEPINADGFEKSFAIGVVGRSILYRNMHKFLNPGARVLNVLASGNKLGDDFNRDMTRNPTWLLPMVMNFAMGNEIMLAKLQEKDENINKLTMVSTHPGMLKTDLHRGQGLWFDLLEGSQCHFMGISEKTAGLRQASILTSEKLHPKSLSYVDNFGHGRLRNSQIQQNVEEHGDWLWQQLNDVSDTPAKK